MPLTLFWWQLDLVEGGEASAEPISEQQQGASNDEGFYEVFQVWSNVNLLLKNIRSQRYLITGDELEEI